MNLVLFQSFEIITTCSGSACGLLGECTIRPRKECASSAGGCGIYTPVRCSWVTALFMLPLLIFISTYSVNDSGRGVKISAYDWKLVYFFLYSCQCLLHAF